MPRAPQHPLTLLSSLKLLLPPRLQRPPRLLRLQPRVPQLKSKFQILPLRFKKIIRPKSIAFLRRKPRSRVFKRVRDVEQASAKGKEELASEFKKRKIEAEMAEKEWRTLERILEAKVHAVEFKASSEMKNIKIEFAQLSFIKGYELCQKNVTNKFAELDLSFLDEGASDDEAGPSITTADLPPIEPFSTAPPVTSALSAAEDPAPKETAPNSSTTLEVGGPK
ncbi:hypothetical protein COCNU_scaffold014613G000030 [Cocos nucifera]|nr:hypothetical protein [Cocos nucifera]